MERFKVTRRHNLIIQKHLCITFSDTIVTKHICLFCKTLNGITFLNWSAVILYFSFGPFVHISSLVTLFTVKNNNLSLPTSCQKCNFQGGKVYQAYFLDDFIKLITLNIHLDNRYFHIRWVLQFHEIFCPQNKFRNCFFIFKKWKFYIIREITTMLFTHWTFLFCVCLSWVRIQILGFGLLELYVHQLVFL